MGRGILLWLLGVPIRLSTVWHFFGIRIVATKVQVLAARSLAKAKARWCHWIIGRRYASTEMAKAPCEAR